VDTGERESTITAANALPYFPTPDTCKTQWLSLYSKISTKRALAANPRSFSLDLLYAIQEH